MKRFIFLSLFIGMMPSLSMFAQDDDLYFVPKSTNKSARSNVHQIEEAPVYYSGSNRNVDEYNRHGKYWSHYQVLGSDSLGNDIIQFQKGTGVYPDSTYIDTTFVGKYYDRVYNADDDYTYTRRMSRWDNFYDPWFYTYRWGYGPYWSTRWGWYEPWYTSYYGWYDPWYYGYRGWYGSWYSPWYGGYYGWGYPYDYYWGWGGYPGYAWGGVHRVYSGHTGTLGYYDRSNYRYNNSATSGQPTGTTFRRRSYDANGNEQWTTYQRSNIRAGRRPASTEYNNSRSAYQNNNSFGNIRTTPPSNFGGSRGGGFSGGSGGGAPSGGMRPAGGGYAGGSRR
ncbi:hypothetical protein [Hoylesella oralis]|uniref:hypothetical protein n=1 Tax=Hoylesella oralis TaxID=28134 RepID=UPI0028E86BB6|nr:hypothetical protein [Hoylesella oralis]